MNKPARQLKVYMARDGFRWRLVSAGRIIAESGEAYTRKRDALRAARRVFADYPVDLGYYQASTGTWVQERIR